MSGSEVKPPSYFLQMFKQNFLLQFILSVKNRGEEKRKESKLTCYNFFAVRFFAPSWQAQATPTRRAA